MLVLRQATTWPRPLPFAAGAGVADPEAEPDPAAEPEPEPAAEPDPEPAAAAALRWATASAQYFSTSALQLVMNLAIDVSTFGATAAADPEPEPGVAAFAPGAGAAVGAAAAGAAGAAGAGAGTAAAGGDGAAGTVGAGVCAIATPDKLTNSAAERPTKVLASGLRDDCLSGDRAKIMMCLIDAGKPPAGCHVVFCGRYLICRLKVS
jgi:hypothetical protein